MAVAKVSGETFDVRSPETRAMAGVQKQVLRSLAWLLPGLAAPAQVPLGLPVGRHQALRVCLVVPIGVVEKGSFQVVFVR
jgi:hypothetical protein